MIDLASFILLNVLGVMSPGPDFVIVTRYGLAGSRKAAFLATLGIACALIIHVLYCVTGVAVFLNSSPNILRVIKFAGGFYILYLGIKTIKGVNQASEFQEASNQTGAFAAGFFTNLFNPKATIFLLSLFGLFANAMNTKIMKIAFAASIPIIAISWFSFLSVFLTHKKFLPFLKKRQRFFVFIMGIALIILGSIGVFSTSLNYLRSFFN